MNVCITYTRSASERSTIQCRGNRSRIDGNKLRYFHRAAIGDYDPSFSRTLLHSIPTVYNVPSGFHY